MKTCLRCMDDKISEPIITKEYVEDVGYHHSYLIFISYHNGRKTQLASGVQLSNSHALIIQFYMQMTRY
jgi:hypothetical protein